MVEQAVSAVNIYSGGSNVGGLNGGMNGGSVPAATSTLQRVRGSENQENISENGMNGGSPKSKRRRDSDPDLPDILP